MRKIGFLGSAALASFGRMAVDLKPLLMVSAIVAVVIAGLLQSILPPPPPTVVGMDIGTTYSCVAIFNSGVGDVLVIPDQEGRRVIPSVVAFTQHGVVVGDEAKAQQELNPSNTVFDAKRFIGAKFDDSQVQEDSKMYPFKLTDLNGSVGISVFDGQQKQERVFAPQEISSYVLGKLKATAEAHLQRKLTGVVIAVPVEFTDRQRALCKTMGAAANVNVLRIINEPTAAAIAYGLHHRAQQSETGSLLIMVFDFGGGTLDVSLLGVEGNVFETIAVSGDEHLGGEDINHALMEYLIDEVAAFIVQQQQAQQPQLDKEEVKQRVKEDKYKVQVLRDQVERLKLELSEREESSLEVDVTEMMGDSMEKKIYRRSLTRAELEEIGKEIFERVMMPVKEVLAESQIRPADVDEIVLVGGSTRIPKVRQLLTDFFGKPPNSDIDPDQAVAMGTAIQAGIITDSWPVPVAAVEKPYNATKRLGRSRARG